MTEVNSTLNSSNHLVSSGRFDGAVALANIFCWAAALLYAQMGAKSV